MAAFSSRTNDVRLGLRWLLRSKPHFLVVLGMHRSGTSLVSKTLSLIGADAGPVGAEQAHIQSDEVHWEGSSLTWINDQMLQAADGSWDCPPTQVLGTSRDLWRMRRFLWEFAGRDVATFKDPRTCLTYHVWRRVLPPHSIVACFRHPANVARSLQVRDGFSLERGLALWGDYNTHLLRHVESGPRVYYFQFDEGREGLSRLALRLSRDFPSLSPQGATEHYSADSHRHRESGTELPSGIQGLYDRLVERAAAQESDVTPVVSSGNR